MNVIDILLATYNSEKYLAAQLDSIVQQDIACWQLLIQDGGSIDGTLAIVNEYCQRYPDRIRWLESNGKNMDARTNFSKLLIASTAPYVMFSDHDDIWLPDKITKTMCKMQEAESQYGGGTPLLVFSDQTVVDEKLREIAGSFFHYQHIDPYRTALAQLLVQNVPSGCTMMVNRALVIRAGTIPPQAVMHDHWLALTATLWGRLIYLNEATMKYRQHESNIFGASRYGIKYLWQHYRNGKKLLRNRLWHNVEQAMVLLERFHAQLSPMQIEILTDFCHLPTASRWERCCIIVRHHIYKNGWGRNLGMFYTLC